MDWTSGTRVARRFLLSRGLEVARDTATAYVEKYIDVSTGNTVVILPESNSTYQMLSHYVLGLTAEAVRKLLLEAEDSEISNAKRGRTTPPPPWVSTKKAKN